jgi:nucleoside-diphosphate-sugar epimerase
MYTPESYKEKVLVTGGCGFVGSHIVESLVQKGYKVVIIDNFSTGKISNVDFDKLTNQNIEVIEGDICNESLVNKVVRGCKYVFHQAAVVSVPQSIEDPIGTSKITYGGTINVLEAASQHGVKRVVFASSASVYGEDPTLPKLELMSPQPITPYAIDKLSSEFIGRYYARAAKVEFVALRYFNVFGMRQDPSSPYSGVISLFCNWFSQSISPTIYGNGLQSRDFVHVSDVVAANLLVMLHPDVNGKVFNVGLGKSTTLLDLIDVLNKLTKSNLLATFKPERLGDIRHSLADISMLKKLGWQPKTLLEEGLFNLIQH